MQPSPTVSLSRIPFVVYWRAPSQLSSPLCFRASTHLSTQSHVLNGVDLLHTGISLWAAVATMHYKARNAPYNLTPEKTLDVSPRPPTWTNPSSDTRVVKPAAVLNCNFHLSAHLRPCRYCWTTILHSLLRQTTQKPIPVTML